MEPEVVKRRGRKRKRKDGEDVEKKVKKSGVKTGVPPRSKVFIGKYVKKEFDDSGEFLGKIVSYESGLYRVDYEDGDCEDLESHELKKIIVNDDEMDAAFHKRKKSLDEYIVKKLAKIELVKSINAANTAETAKKDVKLANNKVEAVRNDDNSVIDKIVELANSEKVEISKTEIDSESSSDDSDYEQQSVNVVEVESQPLGPPPQLPPSSGNFGIPEEHVSYLLSVYSLLRSFSVCLFLSPFGLDEFVGALNSSVHNTLMDAIHVALMRALKSHVEILSSEGSELASKCLRSMDWSLLDSLTWPIFIVQYITTMRYTEGPEWKEFYVNVLEKDYYTLPAGRKLTVLQLLCDDASNSAELRAEIDMREESEVGPNSDESFAFNDEITNPRARTRPPNEEIVIPRGRGRPPKIPLPKVQEIVKNEPENHIKTPDFGADVDADVDDDDGNGDECRLCGMDGTLVCCDGCPSSYHSRCIGVLKSFMPEGEWYCPECTINRNGPKVTKKTGLKGAEFFGIDPYEQVFLGSCDHLLVMKTSKSLEVNTQYYSPVDIQKVLNILTSSAEYRTIYTEICKNILEYWEIPENILFLNNNPTEIDKDFPKKESDNDTASNGENCKDLGLVQPSENGNCEMTNMPLYKKEAEEKLYMDTKLYTGASYKPQVYTNVYIHGDFAASAGASLAILLSEEKLGSQSQPSGNHRKFMSANYSLQAKAFSVAAKRFYWPNYEKKLVEFSRERCGWCLSCKATVSSKKGCLLNAAAANAVKSSGKILGTLNQLKNGESGIGSIATYVMFMEESLYGLTVGSFVNGSYRIQWRKKVEEAASLAEIKAYLLQFEKNIRDIAFSPDWIKLVDDLGFENQTTQNPKNAIGPTQKRGPGRRGRKPTITTTPPPPEITDSSDVKDSSTVFAWWRGGMLSKHIFQKAVLPKIMIKNAARQGGCGRIDGLQYDGLKIPKRSRQLLWRAAVDMSKTASQLALQVRYLDLHVRWNELVCPEQPLHDTKGPEAEASAFRNASIIDKKYLNKNKIIYGVVFENQKHLPSRVLKKVLEIEETEDKKEKNWFVEAHIPLYLIKDYEMKMAKTVIPTVDINKHVTKLASLGQKRSKGSGKNIFSFLSQKMDTSGRCFCTSCQLDVPFRFAAMCRACQGYCHEQCAVGSNIQTSGRFEFIITCKRCHVQKESQHPPKNEIIGDSPTSPLLLQKQESQHPPIIIKIKLNGHEKPLEYSNQSSKKTPKSSFSKINRSGKQIGQNSNMSSKKKSNKSKNSSGKLVLGLIWKKRSVNDTGIDFRINNILLKNNPNGHLVGPTCHLCTKPYNSDLMYIKCEKCNNWFHGDSVELEESKIRELYGFKCCRCRRIRIPICPYTDPETRKRLEAKKAAMEKSYKQRTLESDSDSDLNSEAYNDQINALETDSTPVFDSQEAVNVNVPEEYPFYYSFPHVDQVNNEKVKVDSGFGPGIGPGPKKLPVRRHIKPEKESDGIGLTAFEIPANYAGNNLNSNSTGEGELSGVVAEWDVSANGFEDDMMFDYEDLNYEDMEFEPQTYFSFNELLASDDNVQVQPNRDSDENTVNPCGPSVDDCNPDHFQMGLTYNQQEPVFSIESGLEMVPCKICSLAEPCPDLFCQGCGLWIHQHCSPWHENENSSSEPETGWKCGNCREWS